MFNFFDKLYYKPLNNIKDNLRRNKDGSQNGVDFLV